MTNEQLMILITAWANRLESEVESLRKSLPETMERETVSQLKLDGLRFGLHTDDWEYVDGDFIALAGLVAFSGELRSAAEVLSTKRDDAPVNA